MKPSGIKVCVVVPVHHIMTDLENFSFQRILKVFSDRKIILIGPPFLEEYIDSLCENHNNISRLFFDRVFQRGVRYYSRLFMSKSFYKHFLEYDYMAISQLDVFMVKDDLDYWCNQGYDNVGAPLFEGYTKPSTTMRDDGNNGGFSLRKPLSCYKVLSDLNATYSNIRTLWSMERTLPWKLFRVLRDGLLFNYRLKSLRPVINEDVYWSIIVPQKFSWYKVCEPEKSKYFAFDTNPRYLYELCNNSYPMAIHAWWKYDKAFMNEVIEALGCKNDLLHYTGKDTI